MNKLEYIYKLASIEEDIAREIVEQNSGKTDPENEKEEKPKVDFSDLGVDFDVDEAVRRTLGLEPKTPESPESSVKQQPQAPALFPGREVKVQRQRSLFDDTSSPGESKLAPGGSLVKTCPTCEKEERNLTKKDCPNCLKAFRAYKRTKRNLSKTNRKSSSESPREYEERLSNLAKHQVSEKYEIPTNKIDHILSVEGEVPLNAPEKLSDERVTFRRKLEDKLLFMNAKKDENGEIVYDKHGIPEQKEEKKFLTTDQVAAKIGIPTPTFFEMISEEEEKKYAPIRLYPRTDQTISEVEPDFELTPEEENRLEELKNRDTTESHKFRQPITRRQVAYLNNLRELKEKDGTFVPKEEKVKQKLNDLAIWDWEKLKTNPKVKKQLKEHNIDKAYRTINKELHKVQKKAEYWTKEIAVANELLNSGYGALDKLLELSEMKEMTDDSEELAGLDKEMKELRSKQGPKIKRVLKKHNNNKKDALTALEKIKNSKSKAEERIKELETKRDEILDVLQKAQVKKSKDRLEKILKIAIDTDYYEKEYDKALTNTPQKGISSRIDILKSISENIKALDRSIQMLVNNEITDEQLNKGGRNRDDLLSEFKDKKAKLENIYASLVGEPTKDELQKDIQELHKKRYEGLTPEEKEREDVKKEKWEVIPENKKEVILNQRMKLFTLETDPRYKSLLKEYKSGLLSLDNLDLQGDDLIDLREEVTLPQSKHTISPFQKKIDDLNEEIITLEEELLSSTSSESKKIEKSLEEIKNKRDILLGIIKDVSSNGKIITDKEKEKRERSEKYKSFKEQQIEKSDIGKLKTPEKKAPSRPPTAPWDKVKDEEVLEEDTNLFTKTPNVNQPSMQPGKEDVSELPLFGGKPLSMREEEKPFEPGNCEYCGEELLQGSKRCSNCKAPVEPGIEKKVVKLMKSYNDMVRTKDPRSGQTKYEEKRKFFPIFGLVSYDPTKEGNEKVEKINVSFKETGARAEKEVPKYRK